MNALWTRFLRSPYRKEPITSFAVTVGAVDAAIGGLSTSWSLFGLGLGTVGIAIVVRWLLVQRSLAEQPAPAELYLPPSSSRPPLRMTSKSNNNTPY
ncbi:MAG: hypothetical protein SXA11_17550 [Cyanobacteriota bacterium]|nr:hypothetical protein [Cyanobacteriota bacterium]